MEHRIIEILLKSPLFRGVGVTDAAALIAGLNPRLARYKKGAVVILQGQRISALGVVGSGALEAAQLTSGGARLLVGEVCASGVFGDILSGSSGQSPVMVSAKTDAEVVLFELDALLGGCAAAPDSHKIVLRNFIELISDKYFAQNARLMTLSLPGIRARVLNDLMARGRRGEWVSLPFDRQAQADYLGCERSALSRELAAMRRAGLIEYKKNQFRLL